jgi:hypothetical protein
MTFDFTDFEMPLLQALFKLGGKARTKDVYPEVEKIMGLTPSSFKAHKHNPSQCDIVICWEHDWADCPLEVLCLKDIVNK